MNEDSNLTKKAETCKLPISSFISEQNGLSFSMSWTMCVTPLETAFRDTIDNEESNPQGLEQ